MLNDDKKEIVKEVTSADIEAGNIPQSMLDEGSNARGDDKEGEGDE